MIKFGAFLLALLMLPLNVFADTVGEFLFPNTVISGACTVDNLGTYDSGVEMVAVYEYNTYTCNAGYYLPAYSTECVVCPENSYCGGGDYVFSETETKGKEDCPSGTVSPAGSVDESACVGVVVCEPGYYAAANQYEAVICPPDHYCGGGSFAISDQDSGIMPCPNGFVAPAGTTDVGECGKVMHIGDDVMYLTSVQQTSPAMAVRVGDDVFYARTTPLSQGAKTVSKDATQQLRLKVDGVEYSIHDNTIKGE